MKTSSHVIVYHRLFIGIPCPESSQVRPVLDELRVSQNAGLRVAPPENLHITLKFLGPTPVEQIRDICAAMDQAFSGIPAFTVGLAAAGHFKDALWLGVAEHPVLSDMVARCNFVLAQLGFERDRRPFRPHVTVARITRASQFDGEAWARANGAKSWGALPVSSAHLYRSETLAEGARYTVLHTSTLL